MTKPGLLWVNSKITSPELSKEAFTKWYNDVHIPDIFASGGITSACRYESVDPSADRPFLALYPAKDFDFFTSQAFREIPVIDKTYFPGPSHKCYDFVDFDTRFYEWVHSYEKEGVKAGPADLIISAALSPAPGTEEDFDAWYREEHYGTLAECKGYIRTRRYRFNRAAVEGVPKPPTFLALHEFEGESLPEEDLAKTAETEWSKRTLGSLVGQEIKVFRLHKGFGDVESTI